MRRTRRRRSTSSCVSPGPRVPMPPACWLSDRPRPAQPGQPVAQERQLHLGLALGAAGVLGEDVEDHRGAVDGGAPEELLQVAVLGRRQLVVEDDGVGVEARAPAPRSPPPCLGRRTWPDRERRAAVRPRPTTSAPGAVDELGQLVELRVDPLGGQAGEDDADQDDALPERALDERPGQQIAQESIPGWISTSATMRTGPARWAEPPSPDPSATSSTPPGLRTRTAPSGHHGTPVARRRGRGDAARAAGEGLPRAALVDPEVEQLSGVVLGHGDPLHVDAAVVAALELRARARRRRPRPCPGRAGRDAGCPRRPSGPAGRRARRAARGRR